MRPWLVRLCLLLLCFGVRPAAAQPGPSRVSGQVTDPSGAPLAGAIVTIVFDGRATGSPAITDQRGAFEVSLPAGDYSLTVSADGFREQTRAITVPLANRAADFVLAIAGVRETVAVKGVPAEPVTIIRSATKTPTPLLDTPQSVTVVSQTQIRDQQMLSMGDVMRYVPGVAVHQGENNRDQIIIRGNSSSADFFVNGVRDDVQYYRDLYNLSRVEVLKGPNALIFGRGGAGGVVNRVGKEAGFEPLYEMSLQGGMYGDKRVTADVDHSLRATRRRCGSTGCSRTPTASAIRSA